MKDIINKHYENEIENSFIKSSYEDCFPNEMNSNIDSLNEDSYYDINNLANDSKKFNKSWNLNYHEAAIYLQEGLNNEKFDFHPKTSKSLYLYLIVHNKCFHLLDLFSSLSLLFLAAFEKPAVDGLQLPIFLHAIIELIILLIIAIQFFFKLRWIKLNHFFMHTRTIIKCCCLIIMILEILFMIISNSYHFRISRAFRPIFLIDNFYCGTIRRFIRQIIQSLPPILDMLVLLFFFIIISSLCAFYLFSSNPKDPNFQTFTNSFINLFVLLTTANFPDIMMPSYFRSKYSAIFFIIFLIISVYLLMNLMLAVAYEIFTRIEKEKFRKLLLHRRLACKHAFRLLVPKSSPKKIPFKHFYGMLTFYNRKLTKLEAYLLFKILDTQNEGKIDLKEFYNFYEFIDLKWKKIESKVPFYNGFKSKLLIKICNFIKKTVQTLYFEIAVYVLIILSLTWKLFEANQENLNYITELIYLTNFLKSKMTFLFISLFTIELVFKIIAFDFNEYITDWWNFLDFIVIIGSNIGLILESFNYSFSFIYIFRCIRLLKLFELKKSYRDILYTFMYILTERFLSVMIVVLILFYSFSIIGMELFSTYDLRNCCKGTEYSSFFEDNLNGSYNTYYFLNNFDNIISSYVTLFQLMVANNWKIIMEVYTYLYSPLSRIYFISFYLFTLIVITIVIAFILEAFLFRIQYRNKLGNIDKDTKVLKDVEINQNEYEFCFSENALINDGEIFKNIYSFIEQGRELSQDIETIHHYHGGKTRTKFLFSMKMYMEEINQWIEDCD